MNKVLVKAPAKLNLTLDIKNTNAANYHIMDMIMQAVDLYEEVLITKSDDISVTMKNSDVPTNKHNTAYKAAMEFFNSTGLLAGCDIIINKNVPIRAGMGGGSADAAAVLVGLNKLYKAKLTQGELCEIGVKIGADVPFCIIGGTARVNGIGDLVTPINDCPQCYFTVCMPPEGVSTAVAFAKYDEIGTLTHPNSNIAQQAIQNKDLYALAKEMGNAFEHSTSGEHTRMICRIMQKCNALTSLMTGSGAAVYGVFDNEDNAKKALKLALAAYKSCWILRPVTHGAYVVEEI